VILPKDEAAATKAALLPKDWTAIHMAAKL
jgi:hypothetical protein